VIANDGVDVGILDACLIPVLRRRMIEQENSFLCLEGYGDYGWMSLRSSTLGEF
jgi:hypothetical protein